MVAVQFSGRVFPATFYVLMYMALGSTTSTEKKKSPKKRDDKASGKRVHWT